MSGTAKTIVNETVVRLAASLQRTANFMRESMSDEDFAAAVRSSGKNAGRRLNKVYKEYKAAEEEYKKFLDKHGLKDEDLEDLDE